MNRSTTKHPTKWPVAIGNPHVSNRATKLMTKKSEKQIAKTAAAETAEAIVAAKKHLK